MLFAEMYYSDGVVRDPSSSPMYECTKSYYTEHISSTQKGSCVVGILEQDSIFGDRNTGIDIFIVPTFKDIINESLENDVTVTFYCTEDNKHIQTILSLKYGDKINYHLCEQMKILPEIKKIEKKEEIGLFTTSLSYAYSMKNYIEKL